MCEREKERREREREGTVSFKRDVSSGWSKKGDSLTKVMVFPGGKVKGRQKYRTQQRKEESTLPVEVSIPDCLHSNTYQW